MARSLDPASASSSKWNSSKRNTHQKEHSCYQKELIMEYSYLKRNPHIKRASNRSTPITPPLSSVMCSSSWTIKRTWEETEATPQPTLNGIGIQKPLLNPRQTQVINTHQIVRDPQTYQLYTEPSSKFYQLVYNKRVIDPHTFKTYPYGYQWRNIHSKEH